MSSIREGRLRAWKLDSAGVLQDEEKEFQRKPHLHCAMHHATAATWHLLCTPPRSIRDEKLTSHTPLPPLRNPPRIRLIPPTRLAHRLISRRHQHNRKERHNQRAGARDAPPAENNAQVRRVPGK
jgi:hypothetical protein